MKEDNEEALEYKGVRVNLTHLSVQGVVRLCEIFHGRYRTEISNGYFLMTFHANFKEFIDVVAIYSTFLNGKKMHLAYKPAPYVDVHLTAEGS